MPLYVKLPVVVEAMHWEHKRPQDAAPILAWIRVHGGTATFNPFTACIEIDTLEGTMAGASGWWIIRGVKNEFYPCDPEVFAASYAAC